MERIAEAGRQRGLARSRVRDRSSWIDLSQNRIEPVPKPVERASAQLQLLEPEFGDEETPPPVSASVRRRFFPLVPHPALGLHAIEGAVEGPSGNWAPSGLVELGDNRDRESVVTPKDREEHHLLELAGEFVGPGTGIRENTSDGYNVYINVAIVHIASAPRSDRDPLEPIRH